MRGMSGAKNTSNSDCEQQTAHPTIHLVLQGKGGVGKSLVASWLAEFLINRGQAVRCIDGDPVNRSMGHYRAFGAEKLDLLNQDGVLQRTRYDKLMERFLGEPAVYVVDSGATAFLPFWTYLVESDAVELLRRAGRTV
jgi:Mrp family chromosome partitioning ATPase